MRSVDEILISIGCKRNHGMAYTHISECLNHLRKVQPIDEGILMAQLKLVMGIQRRYIIEYLDSLYAFSLIEKDKDGMVVIKGDIKENGT